MADNKLYYDDSLDVLSRSPLGKKLCPRIQLVTVKDLLEGRRLQLPESRVDVTFKKAPRSNAKQRALEEGDIS